MWFRSRAGSRNRAVGSRGFVSGRLAERSELGANLDPGVRRANVLVSGVDLRACLGRRLRLGTVEVEVLGETRPCELMDDDGRIGLDAALRKDWRGGGFGAVRTGGTLAVGDLVQAEIDRP